MSIYQGGIVNCHKVLLGGVPPRAGQHRRRGGGGMAARSQQRRRHRVVMVVCRRRCQWEVIGVGRNGRRGIGPVHHVGEGVGGEVVGAGGWGQMRRQHRAELVMVVVEGGVVGQQVPACPHAKMVAN